MTTDTPAAAPTTEQEAFEQWAAHLRLIEWFDANEQSYYADERTLAAWAAWQARAALSSPVAAQPAPAAPSEPMYLQGYRDALAHAAFYVRDHCKHGEEHAETVLNLKLPLAAPAAQPADSAMEVDALRYRYWRAGNAITVVVPLPADGKKKDRNITVIYSANAEPAWGDSLDDAIDRALVAKETPHG